MVYVKNNPIQILPWDWGFNTLRSVVAGQRLSGFWVTRWKGCEHEWQWLAICALYNIGFPYTVTYNFMDLFEGLTYIHPNLALA